MFHKTKYSGETFKDAKYVTKTRKKKNRVDTMSGKIRIRFFGIFKKTYGNEQILLELRPREKLGEVIHRIAESSPELRRILIDPEPEDPRPNAIIILNGKEASILEKGLETEVENNDEIVLIPVIHGG